MEWLAARLRPLCDEVSLVPIPPGIFDDPEYSSTIADMPTEGRTNLRAVLGGDNGRRSLIINSRLDVVPASVGQPDAFTPGTRGGALHGRGACDDKGQTAAIYELLLRLRERGACARGPASPAARGRGGKRRQRHPRPRARRRQR